MTTYTAKFISPHPKARPTWQVDAYTPRQAARFLMEDVGRLRLVTMFPDGVARVEVTKANGKQLAFGFRIGENT